MKDITFEPIPLAAGPRNLPAWVNGASVDWALGYGNRPRLKVRCRDDPLAFAAFGLPAWEKRGSDLWIAERDSVCRAHYHGGQVAMREFEEHEGWEVKPSKENGWKGVPIKRKYSMLATTKQDGYAGSSFDITMHDDKAVRLIGPWHSSAPDGYVEVYYYIDKPEDMKPGRWYRKWHQRGGYFGLNVKPELLLDIFATFMPHLEWAWVQDRKWRTLEPLVPETRLPKGVYLKPEDCPGHRYRTGNYSSGVERPYDSCDFCGERREPSFLHSHEIARMERENAHG